MFEFIFGIFQLIIIYYLWTKVSRDKDNKIFLIIYSISISLFFILSYKKHEELIKNTIVKLQLLSSFDITIIVLMYIIFIFISVIYINLLKVNRIIYKETKSFLVFTVFIFISVAFLFLSIISDFLFKLFIEIDRGYFVFSSMSLLLICLLGIYNFYSLKENKIEPKNIQ